MPKSAEDSFYTEMNRVPLLTATEEILCGRRVQAMMRLLEGNPKGPYSKKEQRILRYGKRAKERMISANLRLVAHIAKRSTHLAQTMTFMDIVQEGSIGLIRGVEKFDPERGYKFSTYAYWWIRQGIGRSIYKQDRVIRLPINCLDNLTKLRKWAERFQEANDRQPTTEESAEYLDIKPSELVLLLDRYPRLSSLHTQLSDDSGAQLIDIIPDREQKCALEQSAEKQIVDKACRVIERLPRRERVVASMAYGLDGYALSTLQEIATAESVSREAVRQRLLRINNKMRRQLNFVASQ
jgi:RNA polymerase sigma factor (sigma-70 family)